MHVYRTYYPDTQGGLEEAIRQICLNTKPYSIESQVHTLSADPTPAIVHREEATVHRSNRSLEVASCGFGVKALLHFKRLSNWADIIHYHFPWPYADLMHFMARVTKPTILTYHSDIVRQKGLLCIYRPLMIRFLSSVDRIVCTSPNYFKTSKVLKQFADKVETVPIGVDESSYPRVNDLFVDGVRRTYGEGFFLFVGNLRYYKGLHILLEAIKGANFMVVIVGAGPTERELKAQAMKLQLNNVIFTGFASDEVKVALFRLCRGVVFPSYLRSEAFGVTLVEGAMFGKPLISTEIGSGTSHVNIHGETGVVIPPSDPVALREAMEWVYVHPSDANTLGANARKRFEHHFTGHLMGKKYASLYRELLMRTNVELQLTN